MKLTWLLLAVLVLGGVTWYMVRHEQPSTLKADDWEVAVPTKDISKIFIANRSGQSVMLSKKNGDWFVNDSIDAKKNAIQNLLYTIEHMELKFRPAQSAVEVMVKSIASRGIKVEVYGSKNILSTFYVGGMTNDERGTYVMKDGGKQPYVMHVPGHVGGLRSRFSPNETDWRSLEIIDFLPESINHITLDYPQQKADGFMLDAEDVRPISNAVIIPKKDKLNLNKIKQYKNSFQSIGAEYYYEDKRLLDSLSLEIPFSLLQITTQNDTINWSFYPVAGSRNQAKRMYAMLDSRAVYLVQMSHFKPFFRPYTWFYVP